MMRNSDKILSSWLFVNFILFSSATSHVSQEWPHDARFPIEWLHDVDLPTRLPLVIAHRGSSGTLPEHSAAAYRSAIEDGADVIECDVVMTKDRHLVCLHDVILDIATNVASVFPSSRKSTHYAEYLKQNLTAFYVFDFTLTELKSLRLRQTKPSRNPHFNNLFEIVTLEEALILVSSANRPVGIYPELKHPSGFNSLSFMSGEGITVERLLADMLERFGYNRKQQPCFVQSFEFSSLQRLHSITQLPLVMLLQNGDDTDDETLQRYAEICYGLGIEKTMAVQPAKFSDLRSMGNTTDLIKRAHSLGMKVHAYTYRNEGEELFWEYGMDPCKEYERFLQLHLDGYFTDFPLTAINCIRAWKCKVNDVRNASNIKPTLNNELAVISMLLGMFLYCLFQ